jgi:hypothetical protein
MHSLNPSLFAVQKIDNALKLASAWAPILLAETTKEDVNGMGRECIIMLSHGCFIKWKLKN